MIAEDETLNSTRIGYISENHPDLFNFWEEYITEFLTLTPHIEVYNRL